jgi:hypothetical protein
MAGKKAATTKKKMSKGESYGCDVCGLVVTVDEPCGCADMAIMCCDQPMKERRIKANTAK